MTMDRTRAQWSAEQAWTWYRARPFPLGCNFLPSTAVNSTEMWQAESFDPATIERELGWAAACGLSGVRVFLQYLCWRADPPGLRARLDTVLAIAQRHGLSVMPVLFDDCAFAGKEPHLGRQDEPLPGVHNSGWTPSPGPTLADNTDAWPALEAYVRDLVGAFGHDERVLLWDLYNEPGNANRGSRSIHLLEQAFVWARQMNPAQPLSADVWGRYAEIDALCAARSDVVTFHHYADVASLRETIGALTRNGQPLICTEWMARTRTNLIATHLPVFVETGVGCYLWGLVNGRTQTHLSWGSAPGAVEPAVWFHDLLRPDGMPFDPKEIAALRGVGAALTSGEHGGFPHGR